MYKYLDSQTIGDCIFSIVSTTNNSDFFKISSFFGSSGFGLNNAGAVVSYCVVLKAKTGVRVCVRVRAGMCNDLLYEHFFAFSIQIVLILPIY